MKTKNILSLLLCFCMLLGVFPAVAINANAEETIDTEEKLVTAINSIASTGGTVTLGGNISLTATVVIPYTDDFKEFILDLNGYTLDAGGITDKNNASAITVNGYLTVKDSSEAGTGTITGGSGTVKDGETYGGGIYTVPGSSVTLTGGTVTGNTADYGGGVFVDYLFNVGGSAKVTGNTKPDATTKSNVYLDDCTAITPLDGFTGTMGVTLGNANGMGSITSSSSADFSGCFVSDTGLTIENHGSGEHQHVYTGHFEEMTAEELRNKVMYASCAYENRVDVYYDMPYYELQNNIIISDNNSVSFARRKDKSIPGSKITVDGSVYAKDVDTSGSNYFYEQQGATLLLNGYTISGVANVTDKPLFISGAEDINNYTYAYIYGYGRDGSGTGVIESASTAIASNISVTCHGVYVSAGTAAEPITDKFAVIGRFEWNSCTVVGCVLSTKLGAYGVMGDIYGRTHLVRHSHIENVAVGHTASGDYYSCALRFSYDLGDSADIEMNEFIVPDNFGYNQSLEISVYLGIGYNYGKTNGVLTKNQICGKIGIYIPDEIIYYDNSGYDILNNQYLGNSHTLTGADRNCEYISLIGNEIYTTADAIVNNSTGSILYMAGNTVVSTNGTAVKNNTSTTLNIYSGSYTGAEAAINAESATVYIDSGSYTATKVGGSAVTGTGKVYIAGGVFTGTNAVNAGNIYIADGTLNGVTTGNVTQADKGSNKAVYIKADGTKGGETTLQAAVNAAGNGGVVALLSDSAESVTFTTSTVHVNLNGHTITGAVTIPTGGTVSMTSGTVTNPTGTGINVQGTLYLTDATVRDCKDSGLIIGKDGATYKDGGGTVSLVNVTISNNSSETNGGGIKVYYVSTISKWSCNLIVKDNTAAGDGGGVWAAGSLSTSGLTVTDNKAVNGGGICIVNGGSVTGYGDTVIRNNTATGNGGGVCMKRTLKTGSSTYGGGKLTLRMSSELTNNSASGSGGAFYQEAGTATVYDASILENTAGQDGGGIYTCGGTFTAYHYEASENTATNNGGGIYLKSIDANMSNFSSSTKVVLYGGIINGNRAGQDGGGVYNIQNDTGAKARIEGYLSQFRHYGGNITNNTAVGNGGGIYNTAIVHLHSGKVTGNTAGGNGGGIYNQYIKGNGEQENAQWKSGSVSLTGTPVITGNTGNKGKNLTDAGTVSNVYLANASTTLMRTNQLTGGSVGVTPGYPQVVGGSTITYISPLNDASYNQTNFIVVENPVTANDTAIFFSDDDTKYVLYDAGDGSTSLTNPPSLKIAEKVTTVGEQTGTLSCGTAGSVTYSGSYTGFTPDACEVVWADSTPAGVSTEFNDDFSTLTITTTDATAAGVFTFTVKAKDGDTEIVSSDVTMTVNLGIRILSAQATYDGNTGKTVSFEPLSGDANVTVDDFVVKYYKVDDDKGTIDNTPLTDAKGIGRYLYVISKGSSITGLPANGFYTYDSKTVLKTVTTAIAGKPNAGFLTVIGGEPAPVSQKPIYFANAMVTVYVGGSVTNALTNPNSSSTVSYESSNPAVAAVDSGTGEVTVLSAGTTTITATGALTDAADVYASYTLNVTKEEITVTVNDKSVSYGDSSSYTGEDLSFSKTPDAADYNANGLTFSTGYAVGKSVGQYTVKAGGLTSDKYSFVYESGTLTVNEKALTLTDFTVTAAEKKYDGTKTATVTATVNSTALVNGDKPGVTVSGSFAGADVKTGENVAYTITGLTGAKAANYKLSSETLSGTTTANITKMNLTVHYPTQMTYIYDGSEKVPNVTVEDENGKQFYDFTLKYGESTSAPKNVGEYAVSVAVASENYNVVTAAQNLTITKANAVVWASAGTAQLYTGKARTITTMSAPKLGVEVAYYTVTEDGKVGEAVQSPTMTGKYLYVITLNETASKNYAIGDACGTVITGTAVSNYTEKSNCGIMTVSNNVQPELNFAEAVMNKTYEDPAFINTVTGGAEDAVITYSVQTGDCVTVNENTGEISIVKPGSAVIRAVATKTGYDDAEARFTVIVSKKSVTITLDKETDMIYKGYYEGEEHLIVAPYTISNPNVTDLVFTYTQRDDNEKHTPYKVNTYYVTIQVNPENEFYRSNLVSGYMDILKYTIVDGDDKYFTFGNMEVTYNANCQTPVITAGDPNMGTLTFKYFLNGEEVEKPTDAGTYTVKVSMTESDDFNAVTDVTLTTTFTILPKPVELEWSGNPTYNGGEQTISASVTNACEGTRVRVSAYTGNTETAAGTYNAEATELDNPNYTPEGGTNVTHEWSIEKAKANVKVKSLSVKKGSESRDVVYGLDVSALLKADREFIGTPAFALTDKNNVPIEIEDALSADGDYTITWTNPDEVVFNSNYDVTKTTTAVLQVFSSYVFSKSSTTSAPTTYAVPVTDVKGRYSTFRDLGENAWYKDDISFCLDNGYMSGHGDGTFEPYGSTTRAQIAVVLYNLAGNPDVTLKTSSFSDVNTDFWYTDAILWCEETGIISGTGDGLFNPNGDITREAMFKMFYGLVRYNGDAFSGAWMLNPSSLGLNDFSDVSDWAQEAVIWLGMKGIVEGDENHNALPHGNANRASVASLIKRFAELYLEAN